MPPQSYAEGILYDTLNTYSAAVAEINQTVRNRSWSSRYLSESPSSSVRHKVSGWMREDGIMDPG